MPAPDLINLGLLFAAILAAIYARWSASYARRAIEVALLDERIRIFKGFLQCRAEVTARGDEFRTEILHEFYDYLQLVEFYFDAPLYVQAKAVVDILFKIDGHRQERKHPATLKRGDELTGESFKLLSGFHTDADKLVEAFKDRLRGRAA